MKDNVILKKNGIIFKKMMRSGGLIEFEGILVTILGRKWGM